MQLKLSSYLVQICFQFYKYIIAFVSLIVLFNRKVLSQYNLYIAVHSKARTTKVQEFSLKCIKYTLFQWNNNTCDYIKRYDWDNISGPSVMV